MMIFSFVTTNKKSAVKSVKISHCDYAYLIGIKSIHTRMLIEYKNKSLGWISIYEIRKVKRVAIDD